MHGCRTFIAFVIFLCICPSALADSLNSFRRAHGLSALHRSAGVQAMAQRHARSMAARQSMDHDGFYSERGPKGARAENVAWGCATESCAMRMWENVRRQKLWPGVGRRRTNAVLVSCPRPIALSDAQVSTICSLQCTQRKQQDSTV
jgi:Cysteine-rich secretory protein family